MHLAAACTSGKLLPNMERMEPFNVIYQTAEELTLSDERIEKAIIRARNIVWKTNC